MLTGGYDGQNFLTTVEVYNPATDVWEDGEPLTSGRSGHASAVCYQTPCMQNCPVLHSNISSPTASSSSWKLKTDAGDAKCVEFSRITVKVQNRDEYEIGLLKNIYLYLWYWIKFVKFSINLFYDAFLYFLNLHVLCICKDSEQYYDYLRKRHFSNIIVKTYMKLWCLKIPLDEVHSNKQSCKLTGISLLVVRVP